MRYPKSLFVLVFLGIFGAIACLKDNVCKPISAVEEEKRMQEFLNTDSIQRFVAGNDLTVQHDTRGFYYIILAEGNSQRPNVSNTVKVEYKGYLTDFRVFDQSREPVHFSLSGLIAGWQMGLPKIGKGGRIMLILPPSLAYGCKKMNIIEENSVLVFDLTLHDFL